MTETIEWIACVDRMPDEPDVALIYAEKGDIGAIGIAWWDGMEWRDIDCEDWVEMDDITHFAQMPLGPRFIELFGGGPKA